MPLHSVLEASKLVLIKTLLLKYDYRLQGLNVISQEKVVPTSQKKFVCLSTDLMWAPFCVMLCGQLIVGGEVSFLTVQEIRYFEESPRQTKPKKVPSRKVHEFRPFCEFWSFSLGKQARFTLNFCSGMPLRKAKSSWTDLSLVCRGHSWYLELNYMRQTLVVFSHWPCDWRPFSVG